MLRRQRLELPVGRQLVQVGQRAPRVWFLVRGEGNSQRIQTRQLSRVERQRRRELHATRNPRVLRSMRLYVSGCIRRRETALIDRDLSILVLERFTQVALQDLHLIQQFSASLP